MMLLETLPVAFTGPNVAKLPKVSRVDPLVTDGSLLLYEPGHPLSTLGQAVGSGTLLDNLAAENMRAVAKSATVGGMRASLVDWGSYLAGGKVARSSKGGIHFDYDQSTVGDSTKSMLVIGGADMLSYLAANTSHAFYFSIWTRTTRPFKRSHVGGAVPSRSTIVSPDPFGVFGFFRRNEGGATEYPAVTNASRGESVAPLAANVGAFQNLARPAGFAAPTLTPSNFSLYRQGNTGMTTADYGISESSIFYRFYAEDLTVSGRSYADVDSQDYAMFSREVLTSGGRYYNDSI